MNYENAPYGHVYIMSLELADMAGGRSDGMGTQQRGSYS